MKITPLLCYDIYHMLQLTSAMSTWKMPSSEIVDFIVQTKLDGDTYAWVEADGDGYILKISKSQNQTLTRLIETIAHEMVHISRHKSGDGKWAEHDGKFLKMAEHLNKHLGLEVI